VLVQAAATWALVGLIWTMQVVHYPLFAKVGRTDYPAWQRSHMRRITVLVGPLMIAEAATAIGTLAALVHVRNGALIPWAGSGLCLLAAIWLATAFVQAPLHKRLACGFDSSVHRRLVRTNWLRTLMWTARGGIVVVLLSRGPYPA